jgi:hypothetical protein
MKLKAISGCRPAPANRHYNIFTKKILKKMDDQTSEESVDRITQISIYRDEMAPLKEETKALIKAMLA